MGIQYDSRVKTKPYFAYYYAIETKKKIKIGWYETRDEAEDAVNDYMRAHPDLVREKPQKEFNRPTFSRAKPKEEHKPRGVFPQICLKKYVDMLPPEQKPPPDLKFGLWKKKEDKDNDKQTK